MADRRLTRQPHDPLHVVHNILITGGRVRSQGEGDAGRRYRRAPTLDVAYATMGTSLPVGYNNVFGGRSAVARFVRTHTNTVGGVFAGVILGTVKPLGYATSPRGLNPEGIL